MVKTKQVAIQGIAGAFHEIAAKAFFENDDVDIIPCITFKDVFNTLRKDGSVYGIIAIENTLAGSLLPNYNLLRESNFSIIGEYKLRIKHNLCALPGQKIGDIREVYSHPMALMQCEDFLDQYPAMRLIESDDTALSAKNVTSDKMLGAAAICSDLAARTYGLNVLAESIETNKKNFTRFLIIGDPWNLSADFALKEVVNKSSVVFALPHEEGSLSKVLTILSFYGINLTKIQSLPVLGREWEYMFYVDLTFNDYIRYQQSLEAIKPLTKNMKILGEYKQGKQSHDDFTS
ncbi:prephenate dehydratase [Saccharicrinis sp. FJH54]|uniref:prephenate dehydratase n=1 Tax=Saccharicrinis sp. FJH54 TaxID=3344665 RepID=UPI0035D4A705